MATSNYLIFILINILIINIGQCWSQSPRDQALALVAQMTQAEKLAMVRGVGGNYVGNIPANTRLNIPPINLEDGPQGVGHRFTQVTCWPSSLAVAATWNKTMMFEWGKAMAEEQKGKGTNVMLGPDINIVRTPRGGRIFEMYSEDPFLTAALAVSSIGGIQSQGIVATAKHYINNEQEYQRNTINIVVDERSQWELYYPPFQAAVDAGVGAIMCSYNKINGFWACENNKALSDLKDRMRFQGWVMSDWFATHTTVQSANAGLDMEMPGSQYYGSLASAITANQVNQSRLDDMVTRILSGLIAVGATTKPTGNTNANVLSPAHNALAYTIAASSTVLCQNTGNILPLKNLFGKTIAVIGDVGHNSPIIAGGGSGSVTTSYTITAFTGIKNKAGPSVTVAYAGSSDTNAQPLAASADYVVVVVGGSSTEGSDRANLQLPGTQNSLIASMAAANKNIIVVVYGPGPYLMPWASSVKAIIFAFFPGQEAGNALADVLLGNVNPSGKLPVTFPAAEGDWFSTSTLQYPGASGVMQYSEQLLVGYRWYDAMGRAPLFPFGHGLSYASFSYSNLQISGNILSSGLAVTFDLQNLGSMQGTEVTQLYVTYPFNAGEPPKILRGFAPIDLQPNEVKQVNFNLGRSSVSVYNAATAQFEVFPGTYIIYVGSSSRDLRIKVEFTV